MLLSSECATRCLGGGGSGGGQRIRAIYVSSVVS